MAKTALPTLPFLLLSYFSLLILILPQYAKGEGFPHPSPMDPPLVSVFLNVYGLSDNVEIHPGSSEQELWQFQGTGIIALAIRKDQSIVADLGAEGTQEFGGKSRFIPFLRTGVRGRYSEFLLGRINPLSLGEPWVTYRWGWRTYLWGIKTQVLYPAIFGGITLNRETSVSYGIPERFRIHGVIGIKTVLPLIARFEWFLDHGGGFDNPLFAPQRNGAPTFQEFAGILHLKTYFLDPLYILLSTGKSWGRKEFFPAGGRVATAELGINLELASLNVLLATTGFFRDPNFLIHRGLPWLEEPGLHIERSLWMRGNVRFLWEGFFLDLELGELFRLTPDLKFWNFSFLQAGYKLDP